jgi:hypothetical protein
LFRLVLSAFGLLVEGAPVVLVAGRLVPVVEDDERVDVPEDEGPLSHPVSATAVTPDAIASMSADRAPIHIVETFIDVPFCMHECAANARASPLQRHDSRRVMPHRCNTEMNAG